MIDDEDDFDLSEEETRSLLEFVDNLDDLLLGTVESGLVALDYMADVLMNRIEHLYLMQESPDFEGLEELLRFTMDRIADRPSWDIK